MPYKELLWPSPVSLSTYPPGHKTYHEGQIVTWLNLENAHPGKPTEPWLIQHLGFFSENQTSVYITVHLSSLPYPRDAQIQHIWNRIHFPLNIPLRNTDQNMVVFFPLNYRLIRVSPVTDTQHINFIRALNTDNLSSNPSSHVF